MRMPRLKDSNHQADAWAIRYLRNSQLPNLPVEALTKAYGGLGADLEPTHPELGARLESASLVKQSLH